MFPDRMSQNLKLSVALVLGAVLVAVSLIAASGSDEEPVSAAADTGSVLAEDSRLLSESDDGKVEIVEFLDFECEACLAFYPTLERIREEYGDQITIAIRYFPIPSHRNAQIAAQTVEAAAQQGALEDMYMRMYETQTEWGESQDSKEALFVSFARDLGLDMERFERDLKSAETIERVQSDQEAGVSLGVQGTPTVFFNGEMLPGMPTYEDLTSRIDAALAQ